jgi:arginine deiminase
VNRKCALIGVEGNHDQAFLSKVLRELLGFSKCEDQKNLDTLWRKFIPVYPPKTGRLHLRLDMPSILYTDTLSVAIYAGEGSRLVDNLKDKLADIDYLNSLSAFAIVADADKQRPAEVAKKYYDALKEYFTDFPFEISETGAVTEAMPRLGIYVLPNNSDQGVLDTLLCACGEVAYPMYMERAKSYISQFSDEEVKQIGWKPFDKEKATVATIASILKPGKTNTVSISDNAWISAQTEQQISSLQNLTIFLRKLLSI